MLVNAGTREERVAAQADVHACEQSLFKLDDFKMFCCLSALSYQGKLLMVDYAMDHYVKGEIFMVAEGRAARAVGAAAHWTA
ncbi:hypothetical protein D8674_028415 [Pyrus ussuriensis x Pyrus communis]|uniref:Uncharacterized protein n=1 Tax=Pyrus ussuriensis x Pyrus communis TaxID=2448454 RepID=A0A5N5HX80_9ROSA|nr:hypothetical protein D8674_028415 [Pyrus ussuriensis x Pyrus communis]